MAPLLANVYLHYVFDLPGTRSILREPRASLESTRGGSGRTLEKDGPHAGENRPGTGESRRRQRPTACL